MRIIIEALGHQLVVGLNALEPVAVQSGYAEPQGRDGTSTVCSQVEQSNDGVYPPFGFAPVIKADTDGHPG